MSDLLFADDKAASRFTLHRGDDLVSVLDYRDDGRTIALTRAFTIPTHRGHGYAGVVTERAVDAIEAEGDREILPVCWYVGEWFESHPERAGLLHRRPSPS
ncbi:GNAT family N-acetyltransferase [Microbacterium sp. NPDC090007]|uniref:GNAT family N-acetyltransferase n=1 Tax=Microbacterium sp. NPDC090007 TaxID=3364204 RepID=UPI00381F13CD